MGSKTLEDNGNDINNNNDNDHDHTNADDDHDTHNGDDNDKKNMRMRNIIRDANNNTDSNTHNTDINNAGTANTTMTVAATIMLREIALTPTITIATHTRMLTAAVHNRNDNTKPQQQ